MKIDTTKFTATPCKEGMEWLESLGTLEAKRVLELGIKQCEWSHLRWGIAHLMTKEQCIEWAAYCAEQVIDIYERESASKNPRHAIELAKAYIAEPTEENRQRAYEVAAAARSAAYGAYAAARSAAYAAYAASYDATSCADAAATYAADAVDTAVDTDDYDRAARNAADIKERCIWKGYEILTGAI